jgi:hypothetical protein
MLCSDRMTSFVSVRLGKFRSLFILNNHLNLSHELLCGYRKEEPHPQATEMTHEATPRVEVALKATRILYLSNKPYFNFVLRLTLRNSKEPVIFLRDGLTSVEGLQSINSDEVIQCFDDDSGEQLQVLRQATQPSFLKLEPNRCGGVVFTTSTTLKTYDLPFLPSTLHPGKTYRLRFKPTTSITHWPSSEEKSLNSLSADFNSSLHAIDIPKPSPTKIAWDVVHGIDSILFETRLALPKTPRVTVLVSAPSMFSLSRHPPFKFTLTFSTDAPAPITVLAERKDVRAKDSDVEIGDPISGSRLGPEMIDDGNEDGPWSREDFLTIDGTYTEHREIDAASPFWEDLRALKIGEEYVLRYVGGTWPWWSEDTIDQVMMYAGSRGDLSLGLGMTESIELTSGGEHKFTVVE